MVVVCPPADIIILAQVEQLADLASSLGASLSRLLLICQPGQGVLTCPETQKEHSAKQTRGLACSISSLLGYLVLKLLYQT